MTTKAERRAAAQAEINDRFADIEPAHRPSPWQYTVWREDVQWSDEPDEDGWWEGKCPLMPGHGARFNFSKDVMRCCRPEYDGEPVCHEPKRMLSLGNAALMRRNG